MKLNKTALDLARARKCITVRELSKTAGTSTATICSAGTKYIDPVVAGKLATALGVDVTEIIIQED